MDILAELVGAMIEAVLEAVVGKITPWLRWSLLGLVLFLVLAFFA